MKFLSPAKINLFLNVLSRGKDGYHTLETLYERIDLCDELEILPASSGIKIETNTREIPRDSQNLAWQAAALLQKETKTSRGVRIKIKKRIPVSAGLGGGSSNAATVLLGLNLLWKLNLSQKRLRSLAERLGSDVPFFILETPIALAGGRGEILRKLPAPAKKIWHVLVKPPFGISTREAYQALDRLVPHSHSESLRFLTGRPSNVKMLLLSIQKGDTKSVGEFLTNTLELVLNKRVTEIIKIKMELLSRGAQGALMSGSGSAVFGIFSTKKKASAAAKILKAEDKQRGVFVASTF